VEPPPLAKQVQATLKPLPDADPAKRGRRLFVVAGEGLGDRLILVVPGKDTDPYRLVARDQAGKVTDVIPLRDHEARINRVIRAASPPAPPWPRRMDCGRSRRSGPATWC